VTADIAAAREQDRAWNRSTVEDLVAEDAAMNPALAYHEYLGPAIFIPNSRITLARANIQPTERVLDVACGTGIVTSQIRAARVVGLDINPGMLAIAMTTPGVEWKQGSGVAMELPDASFEVVLCQQGLQFFPDRAAGAREFRRVLAPGGRAVIACWQAYEHQTFFADVVRAQARHLGVTEAQAGIPFSFGSADALRGVLVDAGFARVEMETHTIEARFPHPEKFVRMTVNAAIAVMPERFGRVDPETFIAAITDDLRPHMARYTDAEYLQFPMTTNVAIAFA
jgi:ubiquinone/menaquinone biosynthesis C-methylase UbiE